MVRKLPAIIFLAIVFVFTAVFPVLAGNSYTVTISGSISSTTITFNGLTSPGALVTFFESGNVIGTVIANTNGSFSDTFNEDGNTNQTQFSMYGEDTSGNTTSTQVIYYSLKLHTSNSISNIVLPPTMKSFQKQQAEVPLSGQTVPASTIEVFAGSIQLAQVTASHSGAWNYLLDTRSFLPGTYYISVIDVTGNGSESSSSRPVTIVINPATGSTQTPGNTIIPSVSPSPSGSFPMMYTTTPHTILPEGASFPLFGYVVIAACVVVVLGILLFVLMAKRRKRNDDAITRL